MYEVYAKILFLSIGIGIKDIVILIKNKLFSYYNSLTKVQSYDSTMIIKNIGVKKTIPTYDTYELEFSPKIFCES